MPKDVIGTAYVRIVAMSQDFEKQVQASFDRLKPKAAASGEQASKAWTDGFEANFNQAMAEAFDRMQQDAGESWDKAGKEHGGIYVDSMGDTIGNGLLDEQGAIIDEMGQSWSAAGAEHGRGYGDPFAVELDKAMGRSVDNSTNLWRGSNLMKFPLEAIQQLADDMPDIMGGGADKAGRHMRERFHGSFSQIAGDVRGVFSDLGAGIAATLSDAFSGGGNGRIFRSLTDGAEQASRSFTILFSIGQLVGSALVAVGAGIANVISGLFALVGAAGQAASALVVLPGIIGAIVQAGATLAIGFSGVGKAIQEGMKASSASASGAKARASELASAQQAVIAATRAVQNAEKNAASAKRDVINAQKELNDAYKEGARQLRDIQYAAEDAALQEERAAINLADARDNLAQVKATNPADSRAVQEAELAYKEADLAYREARSRNKDANEDSNEATKKGVKGTDAVVSAQDRLARAQENSANATVQLADAQKALAAAQEKMADTQSGAIGTMKAYTEALAKFGPNGKQFIKTVIGMKSKFSDLKKAAGEGFFDNLTGSLKTLVNGPFWSILQRNLGETSVVIGGVITRFTDMLTSGKNLTSINQIMVSNKDVVKSLGSAATSLGQAFISILDAAGPLTREFAKWIAVTTKGWSATLQASNATGDLEKKFTAAGKVAKKLGEIFGNIFDAVRDTFGAASSGGETMLKDLEDATKTWSDWTSSIGGKNQLKEYFDNVAPGFKSIMEGINAIVKEFLKLGGDKNLTTGLGETLKTIAGVIPDVAAAVSRVMPDLVDLGKSIADIFKALQESPALAFFVGTLKIVASVLAKVVASPIGATLITVTGAVMGVVRALKLMGIGFGFLSKATLGNTLKKLVGGFGGLKKLFGGKSLFGDATKSSEEARKEFHKQMKVDALKKEAMDKVGKAGKHAAEGIDKSTDSSKESRKSFGSKVKGALGFGADPVGKREAPKKKGGLGKKIGKGLAIGGGAALGVAGLAVGALAAVSTLNEESAAALGKQVSDMAKNLPVALSALASQLPGVLSSIAGAIGPLIDSVAKALPGILDAIIAALPVIIDALATALPTVITAIIKLIPILISALVKLLPKVITTLAKLIPALIKVLAKALPEVIKAIVKAIPEVITALAKAIPEVITALAEAIPEVITALVDAIPEVITAIVEAIPLIITAIVDAIPLIIEALIKAIPQIIGAVIQAVPQIVGALVQAVPQIIGALIKALPALFTALGNAFKTALGPIKDFFSGALTKIKAGMTVAKDWIVAKWNAVITFFQGIPGRIGRATSGLFDGIKNAFKAAVNWIIDRWNNISFTVGGIEVPIDPFGHTFRIPSVTLDTPNIQRLATGGTVMARSGGVSAILAEAGRNEVVKPLDSRGMTASDRLLSTMLQAQGKQLAELVAALTGSQNAQTRKLAPTLVPLASAAAVAAVQRTGGRNNLGSSDPYLVPAVNKLSASIDALNQPLVGGDIIVQAAPGERSDQSLPRVLRARAYRRGGAR